MHVYGKSLLETNQEEIILGMNDSVVAKVNSSSSEKIRYNDYGEMLDRTGLIYLRARYYDPRIARFIQIEKTMKEKNNK